MKPLTSLDAAERLQWFRTLFGVGLPSTFFACLLAGYLHSRGVIPAVVAGLLFLLSPLAGWAAARLAFGLISTSAEGLTQMLYGAGNLAPEPAHSQLESLVARGRYPEAREAFSHWLVEHPADHSARIKLADLAIRHLGEPDLAERMYQEVRRGNPAPREEMLAHNLLIELYRSTGRTDRLIVELARFADRYRGTKAGGDAAQALKALKADRLEGET